MPQKVKKEHKCSHHTEGSRWQNFHFSGKVILFSVILGLMLVLVGGILMAIGMDRDDDKKSDNYEDIQKKPPMVFVGPAIMGIGGFAVIVGILMCLIETKVCRKRNADAAPLIGAKGEETEIKYIDDAAKDSDPTAIPSTSHHLRDKHRNGTRKRTPSPRKHKASSKNHPSNKDKTQTKSSPQSSVPFAEDENKSMNFLTTSDKFLTPPNSFTQDVASLHAKPYYIENQATASLMQSFTSSGKSFNASTEFQTPCASFLDDPLSLQFMERNEDMQTASNTSPIDRLKDENHKFLTPKNSDADQFEVPHTSKEEQNQEGGDLNVQNEYPTSSHLNEIGSPATAIQTQATRSKYNSPDESEFSLNKDGGKTAEKESREIENKAINQQVKTNAKALVGEVPCSDSALPEEKDNNFKVNADVSEELVSDKTSKEIICDIVKAEITLGDVEGSEVLSDSKTASDEAACLNRMDEDSINRNVNDYSSGVTPMNSDVTQQDEKVNIPT